MGWTNDVEAEAPLVLTVRSVSQNRPLCFVRPLRSARSQLSCAGQSVPWTIGDKILERDAFISYSHTRDVPLAEALQKGLQGILRTPWLHRAGAKVFRDTTSLAAGHDLGGSIKAALASSRYFICLASPEAAESRWVREEIEYWRTNHGMENFLIAVSEGTIVWDPVAGDFDWNRTNALPPVLRGAFVTEPLWVDLRPFRDADDRSMAPGSPFRDRVASLAAPLHGLAKDALDSADLRMQRRAVRVLRNFVAALTVVSLLAVGAGVYAWQKRGEALARARTSASQALAARALDTVARDPRKAAQFALYAHEVQPTGESAQAMAQAVVANGSVTRHLQAGNEKVANFHGVAHVNATKVAVSPDGSVLAYYSDFDTDASGEKTHIHLYDIGAGKALPNLEGGSWPQDGGWMQFSADGKSLAVEGPYNRIDIWDVDARRRVRTIVTGKGEDLAGAFKHLWAFSFSRDGQLVAAAFYTPDEPEYRFHVAVWNARTGRLLSDETGGTVNVALGFDGSDSLLALDSRVGAVRDFRRGGASWSAWRKIPGFPVGERRQVTLSPDGSRAYVGEKRQLWDLIAGRKLASTAEQDIGAIVVPGAQGEDAYAAAGRRVGVYDAALRRTRVLGSFTWPVSSVSASSDGQWVAAGSGDGAVSLFSATNLRLGVPLQNKPRVKPAELAADDRTASRTTGSGTQVWSVTADGVRELGRLPLRLVRRSLRQDTVIASPNGTRAVVAQEGAVSLWDLRDGSRTGRTATLDGAFVPVTFLPDGDHVVGTTDDAVQVVDTRAWQVVQSVPFAREDVDMAISTSLDRTTLALVHNTELTVWKWTVEKNYRQVRKVPIEPVWTMYGHQVVVSAKGERAAVINFDGLISVLDVDTGEFVPGTTASSGMTDLAFSSDTSLLVQPTGSAAERGLQFWDAATLESRGSWTLPSQESGQDTTVARLLAGEDGTVTTFDTDGGLVRRTMDVAAWQRTLCDLASSALPQAEYDRYLSGLDVDAPCPR
ncbi:toll/interleukin-1 receptor domain-containing protein [Streptomyces sp. OR43]|uniref:toll/interleukin-1 receptor domain-containing protein n=1 Tax=Streptomyces sp. or43 TaxID=2478957 RepID=UPI001651A66A|nr:TIR domain-containing protein [Streptomyces sp. or43]